jgi:hypothetical protein
MRSSNDLVDGDDDGDSNSGCKTEAAAAFFDVLDREGGDEEEDLEGSLPPGPCRLVLLLLLPGDRLLPSLLTEDFTGGL